MMTMFLLNLLIFILLYPLKLIITLVAYFIWNPPFKFEQSLFDDNGFDKKFTVKIKPTCDSAKFEGIMCAVDLKKERIFKYIDDENNFTRLYCNKNFSGDMTAGWLYGCVNLYINNILDEIDLIKFKSAVENSFKNFMFKNKNVKEYDRGFLFKWWFFGSDFIVPLSLLCVYNYIFPKNYKLKFIYYLMFLISLPLLYLYPNPSIVNGKIYWISWYSIHSKALLARTMLFFNTKIGNIIGRRILKFS